jgi:hypothetical protein
MLQDMFIGSVTHGDGGVFKARLRTGFFTGPFRSSRLQSRAVETVRTSLLTVPQGNLRVTFMESGQKTFNKTFNDFFNNGVISG